MKLLRLMAIGAVALTAMITVPVTAGAAAADQLPNDDFAGAVELTKPASVQVDTSTAGRSADDVRAEDACADWYPTTIHNSVWYTYTATGDGERVRLSTAGSSYGARIAVFSGFGNADSGAYPWICGTSVVDLSLVPDNGTYTIVVYQPSAEAGGGDLRLTVSEPPALKATVEVDTPATLSPDGKQLELSGDVGCNQACATSVSFKVTQRGVVARGAVGAQVPADGSREWTATADVTRGRLRTGPATVEVTVQSTSSTEDTTYTFTTPISISR